MCVDIEEYVICTWGMLFYATILYILTKQPIDHVFKSHSTSLLLLPPLSALPLHLLHPPYPEYHVYLVLHLLRRQNQQRKISVGVHKTTVAVIMLIHTYFAYEPLSIILYLL